MQIKLHRVRGSNAMAYGDFDFILDSETVYQLTGKNGSGKSSLPVILEEILYNSNSRGIKKANLANRFSGVKGWWGEVTFFVGDDEYILLKNVKASAKVTLTKNGEDISGHTATQTYKILKDILGGLDFKTFSKLVYQSPKSSMDFLSATDANRKKFLVGLLGLERYSEVESQLKEALKLAKNELAVVSAPVENIKKWLKRNENVPSKLEEQSIPELESGLLQRLENAQVSLRTSNLEDKEIDSHNKKVEAYNKRLVKQKELQDKVQELQALEVAPATDLSEKITKVTSDLAVVNAKMNSEKKTYQSFKAAAGKTHCHVCNSKLDVSQQEVARDIAKNNFMELKPERDDLQTQLDKLILEQEKFTKYNSWNSKLEKAIDKLESFELGEEATGTRCKTDTSFLSDEIKELQEEISRCKTDIENAKEHNTEVRVNNAKRDEIIRQHEEYHKELESLNTDLEKVSIEVEELSILAKAFGSKGLLSYKIESNVKIFEELINKYLSIFTDGQFALGFVLDDSRLKVVIYDTGIEVGMESLSTGEENKVNISTLLAIRNLMSVVSSVELNLLFLDEVVSFLDVGAMDTLVDMMLEEKHLSTFLVSHGYEHPLTKTIKLEKKNGKTEVING